MVYIHGGALKYDSNSMKLHSPEHLIMENVIVVTINFRQHILGFLSLPKMGIPGNNGLKDQQLALEWIYENISNFNGDQNKICLFGESSGAACVHFHVLNEKSRTFISSAICQSGNVLSKRYFQDRPQERINLLSKHLGCQSDAVEDIYETLMNVSAKDLYDNCDSVRIGDESEIEFKNKWRMVVEAESSDAFITKTSVESIISQAGRINIPIIFGTNNGEGIAPASKMVARQMLDIAKIRPLISPSIRSKADTDELLELVKSFYFDNHNLSEKNVTQLVKLLTDLYYLIDQTKSSELHALHHPESKQFLYEFQFVGELNLQKKFSKLQNISLAAHADDVFYLFGGTLADKIRLTESTREWKMRKTMCKLWTNFAKYGDPTPDNNNPLCIKWHPVQSIAADSVDPDFDYLILNDEIKLVRNLNKNRIDFWRRYLKWNDDFIKARL